MILPLLLTLAASDVTVTLPAATEVVGTELSLGTVATVTGSDDALVDRVEALGLGYAPAPGYSRLLHAARIERELAAAFPTLSVTFAGEPAVRVTPATTRIQADDLRAEALRALRAHGGPADLEVTPRGALADLDVPRATETLSLHARFDEPVLRSGNLNVPVEIRIDGVVWRTVWTAWKAGVYAHRPVLTVDVPRGTPISAALIEFRRVEVTARPAGAVLRVEDLTHVQATRDLSAGHIVTRADVRRMVVSSRGDTVTLVVKKGRIEARSMAVLLEDARIGDRVRVQVKSSGREVLATFTSKDLVEIELR